MDAFVSRKRRRASGPEDDATGPTTHATGPSRSSADEEESTDFKLALLASLHPDLNDEILLDALLTAEGSVEQATEALTQSQTVSPRKKQAINVGYQSSLSSYRITPPSHGPSRKALVKKGKTLFLYSPEDIEAHTPCSIIHNFLPQKQADALTLELCEQAPTYEKLEFQLFDRVVKSPHTFCFYVNSLSEAEEQKKEYIYDGRRVEVGKFLSFGDAPPNPDIQ
jgi:hypothetical protein